MGLWQLNCALAEDLQERNRLIAILTGDLQKDTLDSKMVNFLKEYIYLTVGQEYFWTQLLNSLPEKQCGAILDRSQIVAKLAEKWNLFPWNNQSNGPKKYDAFMSYAWEDSQFVVDNMTTSLRSHDLNICIDRDEFPAGNVILGTIAKCVQESNRVIVFLTPSYIQSRYGLWEFNSSFVHFLTDGDLKGRLIVIKDPSIDIKELQEHHLVNYLNTYTYIEKDSEYFMDILLSSLMATRLKDGQ